MKAKKLFFTVLATAFLAGCSNDVQEETVPPRDFTGKAFLSLSLKNNASMDGVTRAEADKTHQGTEAESRANTVTVLLFNEMNVCLDVVDFPNEDIGNSQGSGNPSAAASEAKAVPKNTKRVFVIINPPSGSNWAFTASTVKNKTWEDINSLLTDANIAKIATDNSFVMTSAGTYDNGALTNVTVYPPDGNSQEAIDAAKALAKNAPAEIYVDRLASKVTVSEKGGGATVPTDATFTFQGWELSVTNKSVRLYSDLINYTDQTNGAVYRKDNNYLLTEQPENSDEMKAAFDYLTNGTQADASDMSEVARDKDANAYCLENTMAADAQKLGYTTKVVVKAKYAPKGFTTADNYFFWNGNYYTFDALKAAYTSHADNSGLKVDLPIFLYKAGLMDKSVYEGSDQNAKNNAVTALTVNQFDEKTGIKARYLAVRYYHESVCYYDVLIRHDQNVTTDMALGRYGVVRNNWYNITINSASNPGTPWIPDPSEPKPTNPTDPTTPPNPTDPDTDDDETNAYLSVKITINPWTFWSQGADLH